MDGTHGLELRPLRYFAAVAEAGTVTEAARRLHLARPSLSQQIAQLERRIGIPLFRRLPRGMELTDAGRHLLAGVHQALSVLDTAVAAARTLPPPAAVGVCRGVPAEVLEHTERILTRDRPVRAAHERVDSARQPDLLRGGALALGILRAPLDHARGPAVRTVRDEPLGVVMHGGHPLAGRSELRWDDLAAQRLLWFPEHRAPGYASAVRARLAEHGWTPDTFVEDSGSGTLFRHALVGRDDVVALRPGSAAADADPALVHRPVGPRPPRERLLLAAAADSLWAGLLPPVTAV
ncbi:LysR family transcriptional regulator [Streptomyces tropicalis]|uniref:LysR family transcriptional regulator n=1 Tax=Streptomyces tropicalis TaxID=3034234 RepID=A0ABT6A1R4_9ACTN|nr:LysR family transcriptional regulator [Streptomyces tropicalis]MDF3298583.1 LysR family transcriptional regulator [Streptomyces tropicalis]